MDASDAQLTAWLDQYAQVIAQHIREHGVYLQYVIGDSPRQRTSLCYTVGLFGIGHPELLVTGLSTHTAASLTTDDRWGRFPWEDGYAVPAWVQPRPGTLRA